MQSTNIQHTDSCVLVKVNPKVYDLPTIYAASYALLKRAYVHLDGDPEKEIIVELTPRKLRGKKLATLQELGDALNTELLSYQVYQHQSESTKDIRTAIVQRALLTNGYNPHEEAP